MSRALVGMLLAVVAHAGGCALDRSGLGTRDAQAPADVGAAGDGDFDPSDAGRENDAGPGDLDADQRRPETGPGCDPGTCPGRRCVAGACGYFRNCLDLHAADPGLESGYYDIDVDGAGSREPVSVWCDMQTDGGGWTLVGRTAGTIDAGNFGWTVERGSVHNDNEPYSLGLGAALVFEEILVGSRGEGKSWDGSVYRVSVGNSFVKTYPSSAAEFGVSTVMGDCDPDGGPYMLANWGHTSTMTHFFFRDNITYDIYGMRPNGFATFQNNCQAGGGLNGLQGMIMVR